MNKTLLIVRHNYEWNKKDVWKIWGAIVLSFFLFTDLEDSYNVKSVLALFLLFYSGIFWINTARYGFTFKYLSSLPLSRKEFLHAVIISNLFFLMPFIIVFSFFYMPAVEGFFSAKILINSILLTILTGFLIIDVYIHFPRTEYLNKKYSSDYKTSKVLILGFTSLCFVIFAILRWDLLAGNAELIKQYFIVPIEACFNFCLYILKSWYFPIVLILTILWAFQNVLKVWQDEKLSYPTKIPKKDPYTIPFCFGALGILCSYLYITAPFKYIDNDLLTAVYDKDYKKIERLISKGEGINQTNRYGYTALMVAADEGNFEMFEFLTERNANLEGKVFGFTYRKGMDILQLAISSKNEDIIIQILSNVSMNKFKEKHLLHSLAGKCLTRSLDYLIEKGANIHLKDKKGQTALHHSAKSNCFGAAVSLLEKRIDPHLKDKDGKLASDLSKANKELSYFLEKRARRPASKM